MSDDHTWRRDGLRLVHDTDNRTARLAADDDERTLHCSRAELREMIYQSIAILLPTLTPPEIWRQIDAAVVVTLSSHVTSSLLSAFDSEQDGF